jgi:hypothetical protein
VHCLRQYRFLDALRVVSSTCLFHFKSFWNHVSKRLLDYRLFLLQINLKDSDSNLDEIDLVLPVKLIRVSYPVALCEFRRRRCMCGEGGGGGTYISFPTAGYKNAGEGYMYIQTRASVPLSLWATRQQIWWDGDHMVNKRIWVCTCYYQ